MATTAFRWASSIPWPVFRRSSWASDSSSISIALLLYSASVTNS